MIDNGLQTLRNGIAEDTLYRIVLCNESRSSGFYLTSQLTGPRNDLGSIRLIKRIDILNRKRTNGLHSLQPFQIPDTRKIKTREPTYRSIFGNSVKNRSHRQIVLRQSLPRGSHEIY